MEKVTKEGHKKLNQEIEDLILELKNTREEKNLAYNLCGDQWHDNPMFYRLEQEEKMLNIRIKELRNVLSNSEMIEEVSRNLESVELGSIFLCRYTSGKHQSEFVLEIVGYGESNTKHPIINKTTYNSPAAEQLMGASKDQIVKVALNGGEVTYEILGFFESEEEAIDYYTNTYKQDDY